MSEVTRILEAIETGDQLVAEKLLPLVYEELRVLARARLAHERSDQTLDATGLVHEAWLRLAGDEDDQQVKWKSRGHFFGAAAEAMRRILIDRARARNAKKRGGEYQRVHSMRFSTRRSSNLRSCWQWTRR